MLNSAREKHEYAQHLIKTIWELSKTPIRIMEVCGTHTMAIAKSGMKELLPESITLLSGPGCPVCVTDGTDIDLACAVASLPQVILATYGDMIRVPGNDSSLATARLNGADIRVIYSSRDALRLAKENPGYQIVLLSVGFETTAPTTALTIETAIQNEIMNFSILSYHKAVPPILRMLLADPDLSIDAFILPGHVCVITGTEGFTFIANDYARPCAVAGFEPIDILESIVLILLQQQSCCPKVDVQYKAVQKQGNTVARHYIDNYFYMADCVWRGIGLVPSSGYVIKDVYNELNATSRFSIPPSNPNPVCCVCGDVLKGRKKPAECDLYSASCTPFTPKGPCMVSEEGSCAASYWFDRRGKDSS